MTNRKNPHDKLHGACGAAVAQRMRGCLAQLREEVVA